MEKFKTRYKFYSDHFSAFHQVITDAEAYYCNLVNRPGNVADRASDIVYWRVILNLKKRIEQILIRKQNEFFRHLNFTFTDIETCVLISAILPPGNNQFKEMVITSIRIAAYRTACNSVFSFNPAIDRLPQQLQKPRVQFRKINLEYAAQMIADFELADLDCKIYAHDKAGQLLHYTTLDEAMEDGRRATAVIIQVSEIGSYQVNENHS